MGSASFNQRPTYLYMVEIVVSIVYMELGILLFLPILEHYSTFSHGHYVGFQIVVMVLK